MFEINRTKIKGGCQSGRNSKSDLPLKIMYFCYLQTEILEETIHYIDSLHEQLIATIRSKGLPTSLRQSLEANKGKKDVISPLLSQLTHCPKIYLELRLLQD